MEKRNRPIRVSEDFYKFLIDTQKQLKESTGRDWSILEITSILTLYRPVIKIEIKDAKRESIFDF